MSKISEFFKEQPVIIDLGIESFQEELIEQQVQATYLNWAPPGRGKANILAALEKIETPENLEKIRKANEEAVHRIISSQVSLIGYDQAINVVPGMTKKTILHAGPPITWAKMNGPMKGAVKGALVFEGLAKDLEEAERVGTSGEIIFSPCHEHQCVGSMAGVTSASMYVHIVENKTYGNLAFTNLSEQMSKILRMGANDESVIERLIWMRDVFGPILRDAMELCKEGIDLKYMLAQSLHMGDECHNRNNAGTTLLIQALTPYIIQTDHSTAEMKEVFDFVASSDYFSGPTWMAMCKAALDSAVGIPYSTVVTTMARNGTEFGIHISGIEGNPWFVGPSQKVIGPMFAGYKPEDAGLDIGDSAITETYGIGGFAMAAAPAIVALVGGTIEDALRFSMEMQGITTAENPNITIPTLDFMGIPSGIDSLKVIQTNTLPIINTAIAHKEAGIGMIGAGITHPPMEAFEKAIVAFSQQL